MIGLQSTGDSRTREMIERMQPNEEDDDSDNILIVNKFVSSAKQVLLQLLENAFPVISLPNQQQPKEVATIPDGILYSNSIRNRIFSRKKKIKNSTAEFTVLIELLSLL